MFPPPPPHQLPSPPLPQRKQRTLLELLRLSAVDTPLLLVAFSAGVVAALGSALLPFLTGKIINYAAIEQDR